MASMERHLEGCPECSDFARDLDKIGNAVRAPLDKLTPLEHQRSRVALLQRAANQGPTQAVAHRPRLAIGAVLMAAAVVLGFVGGRAGQSNRVGIALHMSALPILTNGPRFGMHASEDARFTRNHTAELTELNLEHGVLDIKMPKLANGKRFVVRTKDAHIEVRATAFRVEAEDGRIRSVAVEQGTVEVQYAGFTANITDGGSWRATGDSPTSDKPDKKAENSGPMPAAAPTESPSVVPSPGAIAQQTPRTTRSRTEVNDIFAPDKLDSPPAPEHILPVIAPSMPTMPTPAPEPTVSPAQPSAASRTFAEAMAAMRRGDYAGSADKLAKFAETHPSDARSDEADYLRAIALQRAGRRPEAVAAAKRYLATRPNGAHRADAARIAGN
ncbi:MAG TPA: FecR domain-containing protein, partial [Polyangium sp.]|nr:FecR domain-containing protein [Polyangium sp.]